MTSKLLFAAMAFAATANPAVSGGSTSEHLYTSLSGGIPVVLFDDRSKIGFKDLAIAAQDCSTDTVVCFEADGVLIAMPYRSVGYASDGTKVETVEKKDMNFFGVRTHVHRIEATRNSVRYQFLYSYERGLVAFSIVADGKAATYVLGHTTGFKPTSKDGKEIRDPDK